MTVGSVSSYWKLNGNGALVFPARSRQVPLTDAVASSGPEYVACVHVSIPDVASAPTKAIERVWLYQPPWSGGREGFARVTCGAVSS